MVVVVVTGLIAVVVAGIGLTMLVVDVGVVTGLVVAVVVGTGANGDKVAVLAVMAGVVVGAVVAVFGWVATDVVLDSGLVTVGAVKTSGAVTGLVVVSAARVSDPCCSR